MKRLYIRKRLSASIAIVCISLLTVAGQNHSFSLSGKWNFRIDREDIGVKEQWFGKSLDDSINLPGSMPEKLKGDEVTVRTRWTGSLYDSSYYFNPYMEKYRIDGQVKLPFFLTPDKHYVGVAWYQKRVTIPADWKGERITLFLERPHIETTVWVNRQELGMQNSLCVPHIYDLTAAVTPGKAVLITIRIDNRIKKINVGPDSHSITDQTQGNWNGIVGRIELQATPKVHIEDIQVYPDLSHQKALVRMNIRSASSTKGEITLSAESFNTDIRHKVAPVHQRFRIRPGDNPVEMELPMGKEFLTWDEFSPALYRLTARLTGGKQTDTRQVQFGMREFKIKGKWFYVNGRKIMLRGTVENCDFPLTGYAPMDVASWERVFRICRNYGLNHMRFHSFCPPEAAFIAADLVGFYLQPEGPSWPNHGPKLGNGQPIDKYLMDETIALTKRYGNYASYCMLACGNEPSGRWVAWVSKFVDYWKATDPRRVYTGASVGNSWQWQPRSEYHVKAGARGLSWANAQPESESDYRARIDTVKQPYVSHETGQWCVFPNFNEIRKYTGVNKAKNFEIFRDILNDNHMGSLSHDFMMASGKLQVLCYKHEIEKTLRTPDYAGFQLLALNDYSGQGTALVGVLDVFFEEKEYVDAARFRRFCSPTVPLARIPKFVYANNETFHADIEVSHFGAAPLENVKTVYSIKDAFGKVYAHGTVGTHHIPIGNLYSLGSIDMPLKGIETPQKLNLEVRLEGSDAVNDWDFWVYPAQVEPVQGEVYTTDTLDAKALAVLQDGGNVLITAAGKIQYGKEVKQHFTPVFWNTSWFKMRPPHTTGIFLNEHHPLFREFPTEYHSNLQWWELLNKAQVMQFTDFPATFQPTVQSIDTWFISRKIGMLFEAKVLNGKLMMTSMDITSQPEKRIVARQMHKAILDYMNSDAFRPTEKIAPELIQALFTKVAGNVKSYTKDSPDELKPIKRPAKNNSFEWGQVPQQPDLSWTDSVGSRQTPGSTLVVSANSFGAVADSTVLSTEAIQKAIDSCAASGGGTVIFQPGYYQTGALFVKSGVNLQLDKGVTLLASPSIRHYPEFRSRIAGIEMTWPAAVINIVHEKNASVSGEGTLDCRGKVFWDNYWKMRKEYEAKGLRWIVDYDCKRVRGILVEHSSDITLKGFTLMRTGFWGCQILYSDHCTINGLTIDNNLGGHGPSTDGIDIDSSRNILIENCDVDCNDDNICIKSGRDADGLRVNLPTENVVIRNCIARKGAGLITCGSETSGGIRNILGYHLKAIGTSTVLRLKSAMNRGGTVENIYMTDVKAADVRHVLAADLNWNPSYSYSTLPKEYEKKEIPEHWKVMLTPVTPPEKGHPHFRNVYVSKVQAENVNEFISASGWNDSLRLENFYLHAIKAQTDKPGKIYYTKNFNLSEVTLETEGKSGIKQKGNEQSNIHFHIP